MLAPIEEPANSLAVLLFMSGEQCFLACSITVLLGVATRCVGFIGDAGLSRMGWRCLHLKVCAHGAFSLHIEMEPRLFLSLIHI